MYRLLSNCFLLDNNSVYLSSLLLVLSLLFDAMFSSCSEGSEEYLNPMAHALHEMLVPSLTRLYPSLLFHLPHHTFPPSHNTPFHLHYFTLNRHPNTRLPTHHFPPPLHLSTTTTIFSFSFSSSTTTIDLPHLLNLLLHLHHPHLHLSFHLHLLSQLHLRSISNGFCS